MKPSQIQSAWQGNPKCEECAIRGLALFSELQAEDFAHIHEPVDEISLAPGTVLYQAGDSAHYLYTVRCGMLKLTQFLPGGTQRIVRLLHRGDVAGLEAILESHYPHTAQAVAPTELCRIPIAVIRRLNENTPRIHGQLLQRWQKALREADAWLTELSTGTARARVARLLLRQAEHEPPAGFTLLGREDMGAVLGITTETASRTIAEFKRTGLLIDQGEGRVRVNAEGLAREAAD
ncbi:MAG: Crp/Fnr family transcriptional regulator [Chromatiales bacterium]|nr:Crp/Fnr family transcriptional regulator [Chromatiales bacterium]